jgi:hypothetical protein
MTPNGIIAFPSRSAMPGMMVCIGRLRGAIALGCLGSRRKLAPRFCSQMPLLAVTSPLPKE